MNTKDVIALARKHVDDTPLMQSSARLCLADAVELFDKGDLAAAKVRAVKSLAYSVSCFHNDYKRANS